MSVMIGETLSLESLASRLTAVEQDLAEIRKCFAASQPCGDWLRKVIGAMDDCPDFPEMVELGRQVRESSPYLDEDPEAW